jgi:ferredoxin-thioredoxin reductase catalytic subunit
MLHLAENLARLRGIAAERGYVLNPDAARVEKVAGLMAQNHAAVGEWICPCKQKSRPPVKGADITCPCPTLAEEVAAAGACHCRLFMRGA